MAQSRRGRDARPRGRAAPEKVRGRRRREAKPGAKATPSSAEAQAACSVAEIVARLHHHRQRATYAAVGGVRGAPAVRVRGWFAGREAPENSFVVSRMTGEPIGYAPERVHPALKGRAAVLESADTLRVWLDAHAVPPR